MNQKEASHWLDKKSTHRLIIGILVISCFALFAFDFVYHKHGHFDFEHIPGFYGVYGFISYCFIVLSAKQMRKLIGRKENYYESTDSDVNNEQDHDQS